MGCTPKSSIYRWIFPYKPSIFGHPHLWKPPYDYPAVKRSAQMVPKFTGEMR